MKADARRIGVQADGSDELNSGLGIGRARQFNLTALSFRKFPKGERPVIEDIRVADPMLFVVVALGKKPNFVAAIVEPLARTGRQVLTRELGINEQVRMSGEGHLDQTPAVLRQHDELQPAVGKLLRVPTLVIHGLYLAPGVLRGT